MDAMRLDKLHGNSGWFDAEQIELAQIDEYDTFIDYGEAKFDNKRRVTNAPEGVQEDRSSPGL